MRRFILAILIVIFVTMGFDAAAVVPVVASPWTTTTNAATARTGLSVYSKAEVDGAIGTIVTNGGGVSEAYVTNYVKASTNELANAYITADGTVSNNLRTAYIAADNTASNSLRTAYIAADNATSNSLYSLIGASPGSGGYQTGNSNDATNVNLTVTGNLIAANQTNTTLSVSNAYFGYTSIAAGFDGDGKLIGTNAYIVADTTVSNGVVAAYGSADNVVSNSLIAGLAAGNYSDGSTTGASHTNNVNWNSSVFVSASRGNDITGKRANPLLPFQSITAANAAAIGYDTIVITDGNFIEQIIPRQNIPFYFNYGSSLSSSSASTILVPVSITNLTILGQGSLQNQGYSLISCTSTNRLTVKLDAASVSGAILGGFSSATIRADVFNGAVIGPSYSAIAPNITISPLTLPKASVTFDNAVAYPLNLSLYSCSATNTESPWFAGTTIKFYGGSWYDLMDGHTATFIFNNTEIISWIYESNPAFYGATVLGNYFK